MMDASGDVLFPRRYMDEFEKRVSELHRCVERARERAAEARRHDVGLLLDAADAHEQAAMAYELAGGTGTPGTSRPGPCGTGRPPPPGEPRQRHWHLACGTRHDSDDPRPQTVIPDGDRPGLPGEPDMGMGHPGVSCGTCHEQQRDTRFFELPYGVAHRAAGP